MWAIVLPGAVNTCSYERSSYNLRPSFNWGEIAYNVVAALLRKNRVDEKGAIRLLNRMNMLIVCKVLANDKHMEEFVVNSIEGSDKLGGL